MRPILFWWLSLLLPISATAGGFQLYLLGQRQLGMGMASTALAQDASAGYFNPGALIFTPRRGNLLIGATAHRPITLYQGQPPSAYRTGIDTVVLTPMYIYGAWKGKKGSPLERWALGLSFNNPFSVTNRWPDNWKGKFLTQEFSINALSLQPTLSFRLSDKVGIGAGLIYTAANLLSRRALPNSGPNDSESAAQFRGTGTGWGLSLGIYAAPSQKVRLGLTYRSGTTIALDSGAASFNVPASLQSQYPDQAFYTELPLPTELNLGLSYRPQELLLLSFEVQWVGWQRFDSLEMKLSQPIAGLTSYPERAFANTFNFRLGGEYNLSRSTMIRAGGYYTASPVQQQYVLPDLPDANSIGLTAGFSWRIIDDLSLDVSYAFEYTGERTAIFEAGAFAGIYRSTQSSLGVGLGYTF